MSYYNYYGYPNTAYGGSSSYIQRSPAINPLSGLTLGRKQQRQKDKQKYLLAFVIILAILLVGAIIAIIVFYVKPTTTPPSETTAGVDYINVDLIATRSDITYSAEYADENQNAYQSVAQMTCYQISQSAATKDYIVVNCTVNSMASAQPSGLDIITKIKVLIMNQSANEAFLGLSTALSEVEEPLKIDSNRMQLA